MMLLPSGRSSSDVQPLPKTQQPQQQPQVQATPTPPPIQQKPKFLTRTSSPQLTIAAGKPSSPQQAPLAASSSLPPPVPLRENGYASSSPATPAAGYATSNAATLALAPSSSETGISGNSAMTSHIITTENHISAYPATLMGGTTMANAAAVSLLGNAGNWEEIDRHLETIQVKLKEGWTVHVGKEGRLYYCNHITQTSGWLPSGEDWSKNEELPYGWERAIDSKGRSYYINHLNKSSTYEAPECVRWDENPPEPRTVVLERSASLGFGFVAGSEKPVIVRFVTEGGPSMNKLQPGDHVLSVNGEDVSEAPRDHVIQLVRACEAQVTLTVCQPAHHYVPGRKSTLLSAGKRAKLRSRPSRVRFAESVCVNGAPLFPPSAFSLGDICVPPMANVLKVFLENGQTKSFKYDATTTVKDVVSSLLDKLCISTPEIVSLVLEHVKSLKRNKLTLLDPEESLARIAARPGAHKLRCLFRVTFVPTSAEELAKKDLNALDYLYMQCCNDVTQERFAPELQPEVALRLAALHMHQHALANNVSPSKLTVKVVEREFGLERFVPISLFDGMKRKELRRLISHFLKLNAEMTGSSAKVLTQLQAKLYYLEIIASLPSYGAKCFSTNQREGVERVLLVSPRFGLSQISSARNSVPQPVSSIEDFTHVFVIREDDVTCSVTIYMQGDRVIKFSMEDRDACEFSLVLAGYYRLLTGHILLVDREREQYDEDNAPSYLAQHTVLPAAWSYLKPFHNRAHSINFLVPAPYHAMKLQFKDAADAQKDLVNCDRNMNSTSISNSNHHHGYSSSLPYLNTTSMDLDIHSVMATELLEEAKDSGMSDSSGGGSNYCERTKISSHRSNNAVMDAKNEEVLRRVQEMQKMVENSEQYLNEQGENDHYVLQRKTSGSSSFSGGMSAWAAQDGGSNMMHNNSHVQSHISNTSGVIEFDSDCDSLNSSKVSSNEETSQQLGALKHSDSLVLLAESINHDLTGITQGLNSIGNSSADMAATNQHHSQQHHSGSLSKTSSPRPPRKLNGFGQLLSNLQALGTDYSQSESDSESINSPINSPTTRRPSMLNTEERSQRKHNLAYRSSFGLHSPDGNNFGTETKDYNLKEYLKQLKEISNVDNCSQDTDVAAKKLSEIYGFEIREDTFIETDSDLIDLRALPPPQTPDELDAFALINAPPQGFDDGQKPKMTISDTVDGDLDKFLAKVVVAPPTQKATPAKELTPEEIMSFIIPPPPNLEEIERNKQRQREFEIQTIENHEESLYSNSLKIAQAAQPCMTTFGKQPAPAPAAQPPASPHVIEYATVERKSKFSCCPKSKKEAEPEQLPAATTEIAAPLMETNNIFRVELKLPPRSHGVSNAAPPVRPPKSVELMQRYSPKKQMSLVTAGHAAVHEAIAASQDRAPPQLPPRPSPTSRAPAGEELCISQATVNSVSN